MAGWGGSVRCKSEVQNCPRIGAKQFAIRANQTLGTDRGLSALLGARICDILPAYHEHHIGGAGSAAIRKGP